MKREEGSMKRGSGKYEEGKEVGEGECGEIKGEYEEGMKGMSGRDNDIFIFVEGNRNKKLCVFFWKLISKYFS